MSSDFISGDYAADLSKYATAAGIAASHLLNSMTSQLPTEHRDRLAACLEQGGRVGVEILTSGTGARTFRVVGYSRTDEKLVVAELVVAGKS